MIDQASLLSILRGIAGDRHVLVSRGATRVYVKGYRYGEGEALAVVRPGSLVEQWRVFEACVRAGAIIIVQAANTGLTGGSTPNGSYDRDVVVINTTRIAGIHLINGNRQAICLSGSTLFELERVLRQVGREPHSVIGSSCIGASVVGGICNNSGGALVRRGPAYTEYALFARVNEAGEPELCNHIGVRLGDDPIAMLARLDAGLFGEADVEDLGLAASSSDYADRIRRVDESTPARFNADASKLFETSGCAGKVMALAVRVDTFPADARTRSFYIGSNSPDELAQLRRRLLEAAELPVAAEYIHRDAYVLAERYGKDTVVAIERLGTERLPSLFAIKARVDAIVRGLGVLPKNLSDRLMQAAGRLFPAQLPSRMTAFRDRFAHHLILKVADDAIEPTRALLGELFPSDDGDMFECTAEEERKAFLHRFAVAGAAVRYRALNPDTVEDIIALDIALPRNEVAWFERLPEEFDGLLLARLYYGHFLCHVLHQDYIVRKGIDPLTVEHRMWRLLDERGARYPAEHNVGHLYRAPPEMTDHFRSLDPTNCMNPGIGETPRGRGWTANAAAP